MAWTAAQIPDQTGRIAVITGANSGIGLETARELAAKGATVVMACRSRSKAEEAMVDIRQRNPAAKLDFVALDLSRQASVKEAAATVLQRYPRIDLLINNAGVMWLEEGRTEDGFELHIGTNHFGHFTWTLLLLPAIRDVPGSRVVTVSSIAHRSGRLTLDDINHSREYTRHGAYGQSKLANLMFALELERRLRKSGARTISVASHPGVTGTNLANDWSGRQSNPLSRLAIRWWPLVSQRPEAGALPSLYVATAADVRGGDYYGPRFFEVFGAPKPARIRKFAQRTQEAAGLWELSEKLTSVQFS